MLRYSLTNHLDEIIAGIFTPFVLGIIIIQKSPGTLSGYVLLSIGICVGYYIFRRRFHTRYRIVLTQRGIQTSPERFYKWRSISGIRVVQKGSGKYASYYLVYRHPKGKETIQINGYNIDPSRVKELLVLYRKKGKQPE